MKVRVLDDKLVNRIAAGEVVERPASVVRELVDNSVDAGAGSVSAWIERGGRSVIRVVDDGSGMERDDAILCFERHATSKIANNDDLDAIETLGFRGEALSSIASVAKVVLTTRTHESKTATRVIVEGGVLRNVEEVSAPIGTCIEVRRLFYNTPARRKFLKTPGTEEKRVKSWMKRFALAHPGVRFRLEADGREVLNLARRDGSINRAREYFRGSLVQLQRVKGSVAISGLIAHPAMAQLDSEALIVLVNGRVVSDRLLMRAVRDGFDSTLKAREYPVGYLRVDIAAAEVDVNVHPQKSEIRFRDPGRVYETVRDAVREAVLEFRSPVSSEAARGKPWQAEARVETVLNEANENLALSLSPAPLPSEENDFAREVHLKSVPDVEQPFPEEHAQEFRFSDLRYIGQALECYLFGELDGQLYVVDMHAAHERYNYNLIRNGFSAKKVVSQSLLIPITLELTESSVERCVEHREMLLRFGIEIEQFGADAIVVRAVPSIMRDGNVLELMHEIAGMADEDLLETGAAEQALQQVIDRIAARIACHASIRSGKSMEREEVYALFEALDRSEFSSACPHGRPVVVSFRETEIEQWFGRDK